jgi:hypothetical protein
MQANDDELSIEQLKKYEGFENITDDEAAKIIEQLKEFCLIVITAYNEESN